MSAKTTKAEQAALSEYEKKDIEHGRENCEDFCVYHVLRFLANAFPKDRYVDYPITLQAETLMTLFTVLTHTLREDVYVNLGRH